MTLLYADGFDLLQTSDLPLKWDTLGLQNNLGANLVQSTSSRFGTGKYYAAQYINNNGGSGGFMTKALASTLQTTLVVGFAFTAAVLRGRGDQQIFALSDGSSTWLAVTQTTAGILKLLVNGTLQGTGTTVLRSGFWYYIEVKGIFATGTSGSVQLRLNNTVEIGPVTGLNTGSGCRFMTVGFSNNVFTQTATSYYGYDDIYCCNGLGSANNDFLGDIRVFGLLPNGVGTNTNFSKVGGSSGGNFTAVNESPNDADTSYVFTNVVASPDTYQFTDLPANTSQIFAVVATPVARKDNTGSRSLGIRVRSSGEADAPTTAVLGSSYTIPSIVMEANPTTTAAWSVSDVNGVEIGPEVSA